MVRYYRRTSAPACHHKCRARTPDLPRIQTNPADYEKNRTISHPLIIRVNGLAQIVKGQPLDKTHEAIEIIDVSEYKPRRIPSKQWRDCIKKIYEADPPNTSSALKNHEPVYELFDDLSAFNIQADDCPGYDESCIAQN